MAVDRSEPWHLDKKVSIAILAALFSQTAMVFWWASAQDGRLIRLEEKVTSTAADGTRITKLEVMSEEVGRRLARIEAKIDRIAERGAAAAP